jgi:hypothetical protein
MPPVTISVTGIVIAIILSTIIGAAWYGVFAAQWLKALGKKKGQLTMAPASYMMQLVYSIIMAFVLAHFVNYAGAHTLVAGAQTGFWLWFGFIATFTAGATLWEKKGWDLWLINNGNYLVTLMVMGAVLAVY